MGNITAEGEVKENLILTIKHEQEPLWATTVNAHRPELCKPISKHQQGEGAVCLFLGRLGSKAFSYRLCLCKRVSCAASAALLVFQGSGYSDGSEQLIFSLMCVCTCWFLGTNWFSLTSGLPVYFPCKGKISFEYL